MDTDTGNPGYPAADLERRVPEPSKRPGRTAFERDRARVLHSAAFRRLSAKTQVVGPGTDDFVRNRLTHSLEVAQVARELGRALGCAPDVVETAALAHDLGHPPFGHNGERALHEAAQHIGGFEGNAQTFAILVRLEPKTLDAELRSVGLNLTRAVLDACSKYPWTLESAPVPVDGSPHAPHKFGSYAEDAGVFAWMRAAAPGARRCLEAQVMDLADDIAYSVHDVEDAVASGHVDLRVLASPGEVAAVFEAVRDWYLPQAVGDDLNAALARLRALPPWPDEAHDGGLRSQARLKSLTSALIGRFCTETQAATHASYGSGRLTRYAADLVVPHEIRTEIAVLKGIAAHYVMRRDDRVALLAGQRAALTELVERLAFRADALEPLFAERYAIAGDDRARDRVVVDQVASLTDRSAVAWLTRLRD